MTKEKKVKKSKKVVPEYTPVDGLSAVDRQFFEITINDLNQKLSRLRTQNVQIEERNEELESKLKQIEEDRADVMAFLDRTLQEKIAVIVELEDKLSELSKVRDQENEECRKQIVTLESKYKAMHEQLSSEIQLLTGKLNSMDEFRAQRDELLAKFDAQDSELKEQNKRHQTIIYEMERKMILDKDRLRKELESKLLQLSSEFTKSSEIRVAAHTQRLVRENIALSNELDRLVFNQERMQKEHNELKTRFAKSRNDAEIDLVERQRIMQTCQERLDLIRQLTDQYEEQLTKNEQLNVYKEQADMFITETEATKKEYKELCQRVRILEQYIQYINSDRQAFRDESEHHRKEFERMSETLKTVHMMVRSAFKEEQEGSNKEQFITEKRKRLVVELMNMLTDLEMKQRVEVSEAKLPAEVQEYVQGSLGMIPWEITDSIASQIQPFEAAIDTPLFTSESISALSDQDSSTSLRVPSGSDTILDTVTGMRLQFKRGSEDPEQPQSKTAEDRSASEKQTLPKSGDQESETDGEDQGSATGASEESSEIIVDAPDAFEEEPIDFGAVKSDSDESDD